MGGGLSKLKRQEQLNHLVFIVTNFEKLVENLKGKPTNDDRMDYWRYERGFKRVYADLIKNNPTDSEAEALLTRWTKVNLAWRKQEMPESYEYPEGCS